MPVSPRSVLVNWAALVALWAPVYVALLDHFRLDAAHSEPLQWALLAVGACGMGSVLYTSWQASRPPRRMRWQPGPHASLPGIERATSRK